MRVHMGTMLCEHKTYGCVVQTQRVRKDEQCDTTNTLQNSLPKRGYIFHLSGWRVQLREDQ